MPGAASPNWGPAMPRSFRLLVLCILVVSIGACSSTPTSPGPPGVTRIIGLDGSLAFGSIDIGSSVDRTLTIANSGTSTLTVSGIAVSTAPGVAGFTVSWTSGTIAAGASQSVTVRLTPTEAMNYNGTLTVAANQTSGTNTSAITGTGTTPGTPAEPPSAPKTTFGAGTYSVGTEIAAGRYFSAPDFGCSWERLSGLGDTVAEIIASEFIGDSPGQWIVDVTPSDRYFRSTSACGTWVKDSPRRGTEPTITAGIWLVGAQVTVGAYRSTVASGCYWERLRGFGSKGTDEIIDSKFIATSGSQSIEIQAGDVGFRTNSDCGTWVPVSAILASTAAVSRASHASD